MFASSSAPSSSASPWPLDRFDPGAPLRLGVLINLNAKGLRGNRDSAVRDIMAHAGDEAEVITTSDMPEARAALNGMLRRGINVLALVGGDGTLHHSFQDLRHGTGMWPGAVLPVPFGTLNILASSLARKESKTTLRSLSNRRLGDVPRRAQRLLRVTGERSGVRHGCLFGSEMVRHAIELYDRFGGGYGGLSRLLMETTRGYLFETELWQRESWRLAPSCTSVTVDATSFASYSAAVVATCDLAVAGGAVRALAPPGERGFSARVITETRTKELLRMIPSLMRRGLPRGVSEFPQAERVELRGSYTLDGECCGEPSSEGREGERLTVELGGDLQVIC